VAERSRSQGWVKNFSFQFSSPVAEPAEARCLGFAIRDYYFVTT